MSAKSQLAFLLENVTSTDIDTKSNGYKSVISHFRNDNINLEEVQSSASQMLSATLQDIVQNNETIVVSALHVLDIYLKNKIRFEDQESSQILNTLFDRANHFLSPDVAVQLLKCLNHEPFFSNLLIVEALRLLESTEDKSFTTTQYVLLVEEAVELFFSINSKISDCFKNISSSSWAFYTIPALGNLSAGLREKAFHLLNKYPQHLMSNSQLSKHIIKCLNIGMAISLKKLMLKDPDYVINVWMLLIKLVGKEIHKGPTINSMLEIVEIGFKGTPEIRLKAFIAWRSLIDNFSLDEKVITDQKRINLLMLVLKIDNAKREDVAHEKLLTWWHFITSLGPKLSINTEQVVYPLIQFCLGTSYNPKLGSNSNNKISSSSHAMVFPSIQKLGLEVIAHILGKMDSCSIVENYSWTLNPPKVYESNSLNFHRHAQFIFANLQELFDKMGSEINCSLMLYVWTNLVSHVKTVLEGNVTPKCREIFSNFMSLLHFIVHSNKIDKGTVKEMIIKSCNFPDKVLAATAYNIVCKGATLKACPAQFLIEILLTPFIFQTFQSPKEYVCLFTNLVKSGASNGQGALFFVQNVAEMLSNQDFLSQQEMLYPIWSDLAETLHSYIIVTNEVNQGDALEHNFNCMYAVLIIPFKLQMVSFLNSAQVKTLMKKWTELYHSLARLSALVATTEANICIEELCSKLINWVSIAKKPSELESWVAACLCMIECVDFTSATHQHLLGTGGNMTPFNKKKHRPLGCLHSVVHVISELQCITNEILQHEEFVQKQKASLVNVISVLVDIYTTLFSQIDGSSLIMKCFEFLAQPLSTLFKISNINKFKLFQSPTVTKLEKLWHETCVCLRRYKGVLDSGLLNVIAALLEVNFMHSSSSIQNETVSYWNLTFGCISTLDYPESLNAVLKKVKEKRTIKLLGVGWIPCDENAVIAETPFSEKDMDDVQIPNIIPSPKPIKGSLLNKDISPFKNASPKSSPVRVIKPKSQNIFSAKKKLALDFMPEEEFVVIQSPSTRKRRVLTEHQKEVLKEKCTIPAMYNNLDASQDVSLGSHFILDTQQDSEVTLDSLSDKPNSASALHQDSSKMLTESEISSLNKKPVQRRSSVRIRETNNKEVGSTIHLLHTAVAKETKLNSEVFDLNDTKDVKKRQAKERKNTTHETSVDVTLKKVMFEAPNLTKSDTSEFTSELFTVTKSSSNVSQEMAVASEPVLKPNDTSKEVQDDSKQCEVNMILEKLSETEKIKTPRRVPLKKLSEFDSTSNGVFMNVDSLTEKSSKSVNPEDQITSLESNTPPAKARRQLLKAKSSDTPHSARKLFFDPEQGTTTSETKSSENKINEDQISEVPSTQGFSTSHQSILSEMHNAELCELTGSDNLFSNKQDTPSNFFLEVLPAIKSPSSSSSSVEKTTLEENSAPSATIKSKTSSSESSFNISQPTLSEDNPKETSRRKSKRPQKYSPERNKVRRTRRNNSKADVQERPKNRDSAQISIKAQSLTSLKPKQTSLSLEVISNELEMSEIMSTEKTTLIPKIGEVTPEIKSNLAKPTQRHHTDAKRKCRVSKRLARESVTDYSDTKDDELENSESKKSPLKLVSEKMEATRSLFRTKRNYSKKSVSPKLQKTLQIKSKATRCLVPNVNTSPGKKRKLSPEKSDSSDDELPLIVTKNLSKKKKICCAVEGVEQPAKENNCVVSTTNTSVLIDEALSSALSIISASVRQEAIYPAQISAHSESGSPVTLVNTIEAIYPAQISAHSESGLPVTPVNTIEAIYPAQISAHSESDLPVTNVHMIEQISINQELSSPKNNSPETKSSLSVNNFEQSIAEDRPVDDENTENILFSNNLMDLGHEEDCSEKNSENDESSATNILENTEINKTVDIDKNALLDKDKKDLKQNDKCSTSQLISSDAVHGLSALDISSTEKSDQNLVSTVAHEPILEKELILHDWSPSKSPNVSILKKAVTETPPSAQNRRVSFAEPIVSGESPIRESYHFVRMANSTPRESSRARASLFSLQLKRSAGLKKRYETSPRKLTWDKSSDLFKKSHSPEKSNQQSQSVYKATQESQLNSSEPVFPELIDCKKPLDDILPQLTSSFWYRGLYQLMKGRSLNTIGDLCSLSEVQINQLPFRTPKVETVKTALSSYMMQHGLLKASNDTEKDISQDTSEILPEKENAILSEHENPGTNTSLQNKDIDSLIQPVKSPFMATVQSLLTDSQESGLKTLCTSELFTLQSAVVEFLGNINKEIKIRISN